MCYSALVEQNLKHLARLTKARVAVDKFEALFHCRADGEDIKLAKALEGNFLTPESAAERRIATDIRAFQASQAKLWEAELFKQKKRLAELLDMAKATQRDFYPKRLDRQTACKLWLG